MAKLLIEIPDNLHRLVKILASAKGETMKTTIIRSMENLIKQETNIENITNFSSSSQEINGIISKTSTNN